MRGLRIGFGLSLGLFGGLLGLSLGQCSFYLPERPLLCTDLGCKPQMNNDLAPIPPDMKDPNDPSVAGRFSAVTLPINPPGGLSESLVLGPSEDGLTLSPSQVSYPLIIMAPPLSTQIVAMRLYADRLVSHGFIVGLFNASDQSNDMNYRDVGLNFLDAIVSDATLGDRIDPNKVGLLGHQQSAKIAVTMAAKLRLAPPMAALFLIDPADLLSSQTQSGTTAINSLHLANSNAIVMLGEPRSTAGSAPCIQPPQKGYAEFYSNVPSPALAINFTGANLGDFIANYPDPVCLQGSTTPPAQTQALATKFATAYFRWTLKGEARAREYLYGPDYNIDAQAAMLSFQSK